MLQTNEFEVGDVIDAKNSEGKWHESQVMEVTNERILVHYNGSSKRDEWHSKDSPRLAPRNTHTTGLCVRLLFQQAQAGMFGQEKSLARELQATPRDLPANQSGVQVWDEFCLDDAKAEGKRFPQRPAKEPRKNLNESQKRGLTATSSRGGVQSEFAGKELLQGTQQAVPGSANNAPCGEIKAPCKTWFGAFATISGNDHVVTCWGNPAYGGDCSNVASELKHVETICGSAGAFAALKRDRTVTTWGDKGLGGDSSSVQSRLKGVKAIYSTSRAFAAVLEDGTVETWGNQDYGGLVPSSAKRRLKHVQCITGNYGAFAALLRDGTVETWGSKDYGGDSSGVASQLTRVELLCASAHAFAALKEGGTVVSWGNEGFGGDSSRVKGKLTQVVAISSTCRAFATVRKDGTVVAWGHADFGGDCSSVAGELKDVVAIRGTGSAFAALRKDGITITWGNKGAGNDGLAVQSELTRAISATQSTTAGSEAHEGATRIKRPGAGSLENQGALEGSGGFRRLAKEQKKEPHKREKEQKKSLKKEKDQKKLTQKKEQEWERERSRFAQERAFWQQQQDKAKKTSRPGTRDDGSWEFWAQKLQGVLDEEDIAEAAFKLSTGGFKQKHVAEISRDDLKEIGFKPAVIKDFMKNKARLIEGGDIPRHFELEHSGAGFAKRLFTAQLPRIPEEELKFEEVVGRGSYAIVRKAIWNRGSVAGRQKQLIEVAVKMSNRVDSDSHDIHKQLIRDLEVIWGLPHQNILRLHGVSESKNGPKLVYELMSMDLAKKIKEALGRPQSAQQLFPTHELLRVLRDVSAGLDHLHSHDVVHRDVKPANVLLRDELVKLCDFGSSKDLQSSIEKMTFAGTIDYMAPEVLNNEPSGRPADVWSFGVLLFECVTGEVCARTANMDELKAELTRRGCLPALVKLFAECRQVNPSKRPHMADIHVKLHQLVMQDTKDWQRVEEELKRAQAQDRDAYDSTWNEHYANQPTSQNLLEYVKKHASKTVVRQPKLGGKGSMGELEQLASANVCSRLHARLKTLVEECGGTYVHASRKSTERCAQKVEQEYDGDYSQLLDLERATGLFEQTEGMLRCLERIQESSAPPASVPPLAVLRIKDRLNTPLASGYRDIALNVCDGQSGFVAELQLNFHKIAQINSQSHRLYELLRVMKLREPQANKT